MYTAQVTTCVIPQFPCVSLSNIMDVNELLPPGIYRIVVAELGKIGPNALTRQEGNGVTILPPGARLGSDQWVLVSLTISKLYRLPAVSVGRPNQAKRHRRHR